MIRLIGWRYCYSVVSEVELSMIGEDKKIEEPFFMINPPRKRTFSFPAKVAIPVER